MLKKFMRLPVENPDEFAVGLLILTSGGRFTKYWDANLVKAHFHSRKISTDKKFSQNTIVFSC
jgi:hypothetical protein